MIPFQPEVHHGGNRKSSRQLEDAFFLKEDKKLIEKYQQLKKMEETKQKLSELSGVKDEAILKRMIELNIRPETLTSLLMVPLVEVAWADGEVDEKEKQAILSAAEKKGIKKAVLNTTCWNGGWLTSRKPRFWKRGFITRARFANGCSLPNARPSNDLLGRARAVAEAAGGFLGLGNKVSDEEESVLQKLETAFGAATMTVVDF